MTNNGKLVKFELRLKEVEQRIARLENRFSQTTGPPEIKEKAINEFIREIGPTKNVDKVLAVGYFLEINDGLRNFNISDLRKGISRAGESEPTNVSDVCNRLVKTAFFKVSKEKKDDMKTWELTQTGIERVRRGFRGERN